MIIALDNANSFVKVKYSPTEPALVYHNTTRRIGPSEESLLNRGGGRDVFKLGEKDSPAYVVGEISPESTTSSREDSDRYRSPEFKRESIIALARVVKNGDVVTVVTGLPSDHYVKDSCHKDLEKALKGTHTVFVNDEPLVFTVAKVVILLQPIGTLMAFVMTPDGNIHNEELLSMSKLVIDIGWGTTDLAVIYGTELRRTKNVKIAMSEAYDYLKQLMEDAQPDLKGATLPDFDIENQLRNSGTYRYGKVKVSNAKELKDKAFKLIASEIVAAAKKAEPFEQFNAVILTGGGVTALHDYLVEQLADVDALSTDVPQEANVLGYYAYGMSQESEA